jgi:hypothetical protein
MTITTRNSSLHVERVEMPAAANLLPDLKLPLRTEARESFVAILDAECGQLRRAVTNQEYSTMRNAEADAELAAARLQGARAALEQAKTAADAADRRGSWLKIVIWAVCASACFAAEFVLSWNALCFVLNVEKFTVLGVLLGLAPPSGLAVLEVVIARLFEDPWQELRFSAASTRRTFVRVAMAVLLLALAAGNGITIWHLAKAREVAVQLEDVLNRNLAPDATEKELAKLDRTAIDRAVLWVSLLVSIDGAIFLLLSLGAGKEIHNRRIADRELAKARSEHARLETEAAKTSSEADAVHESWKIVNEKAEGDAERYRAYCLYLLSQQEAIASAELTLEQQVSHALQLA